MGNFYTNITLRGPDQNDVLQILKQQSRSAYISPSVNGYTVVFDEQCEDQDTSVLESLALELSKQLSCLALAILNHDDDILLYKLYDSGSLIDEYNSSPGYFDPDAEPSSPVGGNANKLCAILGKDQKAAEVGDILCKSSYEDNGYVFEIERHQDLVEALRLPAFSVGLGYRYIEQGEIPEELDVKTLQRSR